VSGTDGVSSKPIRRRFSLPCDQGYYAGFSGTRRSLAIVAVAVTFSVVKELIADLDWPQQGVLRVSQQALLDVQRSMNSPSPRVREAWRLVTKTNAERTRSANEIPIGTHHFEFADGVTDIDRANL
jgi:hypothetical protein